MEKPEELPLVEDLNNGKRKCSSTFFCLLKFSLHLIQMEFLDHDYEVYIGIQLSLPHEATEHNNENRNRCSSGHAAK